MQILCDHHVPTKYIQAFEQESWITVTTVRDQLSADTSDADIARYAATHDWVVFTNDNDFYDQKSSYGLLVYSQLRDPRPSDVVDAIKTINSAYVSNNEINETVPDDWI